MKKGPLVSVVMPVYNGARYLREACESVLSQSLTCLELIVVNDGSTDGAEKILNQFAQADDRVRVFHQDNKGVAEALNKGISEARGKYIARMDSDDICMPDRLAKQVDFMESHPEVGLCGAGWCYTGKRSGMVIPAADDARIRAVQMFWPCLSHPTVMMRRELIIKHDLYYDTGFKQAEDYELWLRFARHTKMANIPEPLLIYRVFEKQATTMYGFEVHEWSSLVHKQAIRLLGIEPSEEELDLHRSLAGSSSPKSLAYIKRAEKWLLKLAAANETTRAYDTDALSKVFFGCWYSACSRAAEQGIWAWSVFKKSKLCKGFTIPAHYSISFAVRYALRDRTRAMYYRLSKFDTVWKAAAVLTPRAVKGRLGDSN